LKEETKEFERMEIEYGARVFDDSIPMPRIFIPSLMRSGNTLFRSLFEGITGTLTSATVKLVKP
jgi:hypothetical protein